MIALLQRVSSAHVDVRGSIEGAINRGVLALIGVARGDDESTVDRLLERILGYRMFPDSEGKMNRSVREINGGMLLVPQFTLAADTRKGMRPSFTPAAEPADGQRLFHDLAQKARATYPHVATGVFGADMQVTLVNDGPVTFWLQVPPNARGN